MDQVRNLLDRPRLYYNIDGLGELGGGVMMLGGALFVWLMTHSLASSVWPKISLLASLGVVLAVHCGTEAIKSRITYPRTGYVEYRRSYRIRMSIIGAVSGALTALGLAAAIRRHWDVASLVSLGGLVYAAAYAYQFARAARWKWAVVSAMAIGSLVINLFPADVLAALVNESVVTHPVSAEFIVVGAGLLFLMTNGTILLISGGISLWLYLRHTQTPAQESQ